jgi:hypothetical protein
MRRPSHLGYHDTPSYVALDTRDRNCLGRVPLRMMRA